METTWNYNRWTGNAPNPSGGADPFSAETTIYTFQTSAGVTAATKILHVWSWDEALLIRFSFRIGDDLDWGDPIEIPAAAQSQDFYHSAQAWQVVSLVGGATARYQVVGMW